MNVGATSETDYGDYFMWGSTTSNNSTPCDWEHAPFNGGNSQFNKEYFNSVKDTVCPNGVLAKEYDAASQIMGGDWRMPTFDECQELTVNTTIEWIKDFKGTGVNGGKFTSKTNGNSIFIPASGGRIGYSFEDQGTNISVYSSTLATSFGAAWLLYSNGGTPYRYNDYIKNGRVVRGVL